MDSIPSHFEGENLGDADQTDVHRAFQCGACGWVYEPGHGDPQWAVPEGTAFAALPEHWRCPQCDAGRERFVAVVP